MSQESVLGDCADETSSHPSFHLYTKAGRS